MAIFLSIAGGFVFLLIGGETLVKGSVGVAQRLGLSKLLIGIVLVGFGTSTPELVTSVTAALQGSPGIAVGNAIGSNIANTLLIVGLTACFMTLETPRKTFLRDTAVMMGVAILCVPVFLTGDLGRLTGAIFAFGLVGYVTYIYRQERRSYGGAAALHREEAELAGETPKSLGNSLLMSIGGIALTILGAKLLVFGATELALKAGISETVIGLTIVAVGTSLPELATSIIAVLKKQGEVSLGNILGSNIYNIVGILGITALLKPIPVPEQIIHFDMWVMVGVTLLLSAMILRTQKITRPAGIVFLTLYASYNIMLYTMNGAGG